jgi:hypothetical protein
MGHQYDVFVSYRQEEPDQSWTRMVLVPALDAERFNVCIDHRSFEIGVSLIESMARAVESSRFTLAVLSPRFLTSGFTTLERTMAQYLVLEERQRRFIGLVFEECSLPLEMRSFLWLDATRRPTAGSDEFDRLFRTLRSPEVRLP